MEIKEKWSAGISLGPTPPKPLWKMDMFGDGDLNFFFIHKKSFWQRLGCTIIFGSKWTKL